MKHICQDPQCACEEAVVFAQSNILVEAYRDEEGTVKLRPLGVDSLGSLLPTLLRNDPAEVQCARCGGPMRIIHDTGATTQKHLGIEAAGEQILKTLKNVNHELH